MNMHNESSELNTIWEEAKAFVDQGDFDKAIETYKYILIRYGHDPVANEYAQYNLADIQLTLRELDLAEEHIKAAIALNPDKPDYHYIMGFIHSKKEQWPSAMQEFKLAVDKSPDNAEHLRGLGWATFSRGYRTRGLRDLHKANELEPSNVNILNDLAAAYLMMTCFDMAREQADKALKIDPANALSQGILAKVKEFQKKFEASKSIKHGS